MALAADRALTDPVVEPRAVWNPWQGEIRGLGDAVSAFDDLAERVGSRNLVWRGAVNADWGLHSSLSRRVKKLTGRSPTEPVMQQYEKLILDRCRKRWRFGHLGALELLAHMQHFGGPTRLLDVTINPLIALWFAVEVQYDEHGSRLPDVDGRLFAFTYSNPIALDGTWGGIGLPWSGRSPSDGWGLANERPEVWIPPAYNERISAQNAGFLIGGTPASWAGGNQWRQGPGSRQVWSIETVQNASSIYLRPGNLNRRPQAGSFPMYTFRVSADAKAAIRSTLEDRYGYSSASIYPDLFGAAQQVLTEPL